MKESERDGATGTAGHVMRKMAEEVINFVYNAN